MIYYCPSCGSWQDIALTQILKDAWNNALKAKPDAQIPQGYPCPQGHGMMRQLTIKDRIYVRPASVEQIFDCEQGENKAIKEESQLFKFNETDDRVYVCLAWDMTKCACADVEEHNYGDAKNKAKGVLWDRYSKEILAFMDSDQYKAQEG